MKDYPFVKCLHPKKVVNPYTCEPIVVSCGHCAACELHKSDIRTLKCELECLSHNYCMFVTLTYRWDDIPQMSVRTYDGKFGKFCQDETDRLAKYKNQYARHMGNVVTSQKVLNDLSIKVNNPRTGLYPYLYKPDLQRFIKRLRFNLYKKTHEKIRYFACGEYGPVHFRPHFHLLIWFDKNETFWSFREILYKSWTFGRVDFSLSQGSCAKYTSSYLNSTCYLPNVYKTSETRPFCIHSAFLGEAILQEPKAEIYKKVDSIEHRPDYGFNKPVAPLCEYGDIIKRCIPINGTHSDVFLWRSLENSIFPKCRAFTSLSTQERAFAYSTYEIAREWTQEVSPYRQAREIVNYIVKHWLTDTGTFDCRVHHFVPEYDKLLHFFFTGFRFSTKRVCRCDKDVFDQMFHSIVRDLYVSRQFIENSKIAYTVGEYNRGKEPLIVTGKVVMLKRIEYYYQLKDYENLKKSLALQEQLIDSDLCECEEYGDCSVIPYLYDNLNYDMNKFQSTSLPRFFDSDVIRRQYFAVKHKELNDLNNMFNNK